MRQRAGQKHWLYQRVSAVFLFFLMPVVGYFVYTNRSNDFKQWIQVLSESGYAFFTAVFMGVAIYHAALGIQVILQDYMPKPRVQGGLIMASNIFWSVLFLLTLGALLKIVMMRSS